MEGKLTVIFYWHEPLLFVIPVVSDKPILKHLALSQVRGTYNKSLFVKIMSSFDKWCDPVSLILNFDDLEVLVYSKIRGRSAYPY